MRCFRHLVALSVAFAVLAGVMTRVLPKTAVAQIQESIDIRTIRGLQQRRLYDLALVHAEAARAKPDQSIKERVSLAVLVIETYSRRAATTNAETRSAAWQQAMDIARQYRTEFADAPRSVLLDVQAILVDQSRIEQLVQEIDADMADPEARQQAQQLVRRVQRDFEQIQTRIAELINRPESARPAESLAPDELLTLRYNIEYQAARALMLGGMLYPDDQQASRIDVMQRVEEQLQTVLQSLAPEQPLWWTVQADRLSAARTAGEFGRLSAIASSFPAEAADEVSRDRVQAEMILVQLARKQFDDALKIAGDKPAASGLPQLDMARLRLFAALATNDQNADAPWQQRALELTRQVESTHGDYWGRRASQVVVGTAGSTPSSSNLDLLVRVATEAQRKKQWTEALKALDAAFAQALTENNQKLAYQLAFRAAAIDQQQKRFASAAARYAKLAEQLAQYPDAHSAHLMACWNFSRTIEGDRERFEHYEQMLAFNVQTWPESSSADQTRIWLAGIRGQQQEPGAALTLLLNVNQASPLYAAALKQVRQLLPAWITQSRETGGETAPLLSTITKQLRTALEAKPDGELTGNVQQARFEIVLLLGELRWLYGVRDSEDVSLSLAKMIGDQPSHSDRNRWLAVSIAGAAHEGVSLPESSERFDQLSPESAALDVLRSGLAGTYREDEVPKLCHQYLLESTGRYSADINSFSRQQKYLWSFAQIQALLAVDDPTALETITKIAEQYPRDATIQKRLGEVLVDRAAADASLQEPALQQWRKVAAATRPHTDDWYVAKLNVARLLVASGAKEEAKKLLKFMRAVPPGWAQSSLADQFDALLRDAGG